MRRLAILLVPLVLSGCVTMLGDREAVAREALEEVVAGITDGTGSLSRLEGTLSGGGYTVPFLLEISRDGTRHFSLSAGPISIDVYCRGDEVVRMIGGVAHLARGGCPLGGGRFGSPGDSLGQLVLNGTRRDGVDLVATFQAPARDGDAEAEEDDGAAVGSLTLRIDGRGNARHIVMSAPGESGLNATATHEPRQRWTLPDAQTRMAAAIEADADVYDGTYEWEVDEAYDNVSLEEIEVRVTRGSTGERVATFAASASGEVAQGGLVFRYDDGDGDGRLSERDRFTLTGADWQSESDLSVVVWDAWADAPLADRRIPMPSPLLVAALVLGLALLPRRRDGTMVAT